MNEKKRFVAMPMSGGGGELAIIDLHTTSAYITIYQIEELLNDMQNIIEKQAVQIVNNELYFGDDDK